MTVIISKKVYFTILASCVRFANQKIPYDDWIEVYGIFVGKNQGNDVLISEAYPITHQKKNPEDVIDKVYWSNEDYEWFSIIDEEAFSHSEFTVGWYHSHPGMKVMMTHLDIQTTLSYQQFNPLAISLVFNHQRLIRQLEMPERKGDPVIQLKNDPGFKIFRLDDVNKGTHSSYHEIDYKIEGFDSKDQLIQQAQKLIIDITNFLPINNLYKTYETYVNERITQLNSLLLGTDEYLKTLVRKGETNRVSEVLENQIKEIRKYVAETFIKIGNIKEFMDYLEYKERASVIPLC
jgi:proteasome lid subunit RPN8/RPN11